MKSMLRVLFLFLTYNLTVASYAQNHVIDSLSNELINSDLTPNIRIDMMNELAWQLYFDQPDTAISIAQKALDLAESTSKPSLAGDMLSTIGAFHCLNRDLNVGREYFRRSLKKFEEVDDKKGILKVLTNLGASSKDAGDLVGALDYNLQALRLSESLEGESINVGILNNNIGLISIDLKRHNEADSFFIKALSSFTQYESWIDALDATVNRINNFRMSDEIDKAASLIDTLGFFAEKTETLFGLAKAAQLEGYVLLDAADYEGGLNMLEKAENYFLQTDNVGYEYLSTKVFKARAYVELDMPRKCVELINEVLPEVVIEENIGLAFESYNFLAVAYYELGEYQKAFDTDVKRDSLRDVLLDTEKSNQLASLQVEYETEKKEQEIVSLKQQATIQLLELSKRNNQILFLGIGILLFLISGILLYKQQATKKKKKSLEIEQRFLRSQLNPHFIFNSMAAIQNYLLKENSEKASDYMGMFSTLMRQILENSREEFISLKEEISMLQRYLDLQQLRFSEKLAYEITVDEELDKHYTAIPPMFAQPFIENALEHGLFKKGEENKISIKFTVLDEKHIELEILDNGVGLANEKTNIPHKSLATKITRERLASFESASFVSENLKDDNGEIQGFRISLSLPSKLMTAA